MSAAATAPRIALSNILYLTDFSESSRAALGLAKAVASAYDSRIHALHVLLPPPVSFGEAQMASSVTAAFEEAAAENMKKVESALDGVPHDCAIQPWTDAWSAVEKWIREEHADIVVLGTHGRTGIPRLLLGSVAEEIFRQSQAPVLTVGPFSSKDWSEKVDFRRILFATDFGPDSCAAAHYAFSFAQEFQSELDMLHVIRSRNDEGEKRGDARSSSAAMHELHDLVPEEARSWCRPQSIVRFGDAATNILEAAAQLDSDLIVMGVRSAPNRIGRATHLERPVAHRVVTRATCPVLTVRDAHSAVPGN